MSQRLRLYLILSFSLLGACEVSGIIYGNVGRDEATDAAEIAREPSEQQEQDSDALQEDASGLQSANPACNDGTLHESEFCDGDSLECVLIDSSAFSDGLASCNDTCTEYDTSACSPVPEPVTFERAVEEISLDHIKEMVYYLASDELAGRASGTEGDRLAQEYIESRFIEAGLEPGNAGTYFQEFTSGSRETANVIGYLPGHDPDVGDEVIVVGGHFDHLGEKNGKIYNGADDNASGTAAVIEIAFAVAKLRDQIKRSVVFMAFGAEERGLVGSRYYCGNAIFPISKTIYMINFDMIGRKSRGLTASKHYRSALAQEWLVSIYDDSAADPDAGSEITGAPKGGSDDASFEDVGVQTKSFFTGLHSDYHTPNDTADKINYEGATDITKTGLELLWRISQEQRRPREASLHDYGWDEPFLDHGALPFEDAD